MNLTNIIIFVCTKISKYMKIVRQVILATACVGFIASCGVKTNFTKNNYSVVPSPLELKGDSIEITINATIPPKSINASAVITFAPYLKCEDGTIVNLKEVTVKGNKAKGNADETVDSKLGGKITYNCKIAYTPSLKRAQLMPKFTLLGKEVPTSIGALAEGTVTTPLLLNINDKTIFTSDEYKVVEVNKAVNIYFPEDVSKYNPNL